MANKIEIKKFLERKKEESIEALKKESKLKQEAAADVFFEAWGEKFEVIKGKVAAVAVEYDKLCNAVKKMGIASAQTHYQDPRSHFNILVSQLSISNLREKSLSIVTVELIKDSYLTKIEECRDTYNGLIAVCNANSAKDSLVILENLGFDTSEVEVKKDECTTLITNIDASKLFIVKGDK